MQCSTKGNRNIKRVPTYSLALQHGQALAKRPFSTRLHTVLCHELLARVLGRFPHASLSCRQHEGTCIWCRQRRRLHRKNAYFPGNVVLDFISSNSRCKDASKVDMQMILQVHPQSLTVCPENDGWEMTFVRGYVKLQECS